MSRLETVIEKSCVCNADRESAARDGLSRMQEDIENIRTADRTVGGEMNKFRVICEPPPITPRCRVEDLPPSPYIVSEAMQSLNSSGNELEDELNKLRPPAADKKFDEGLAKLKEQMQSMIVEIKVLNELTDFKTISQHHYDKSRILAETEKIDKLARGMEKTRKQMEKDLTK